MVEFLAALNLTPHGLVILLVTMLLVGLAGIIGRQHEKTVQRTPFSLRVWASDWVNIATPFLNFFTAVVLLSIRDSLAPMFGVAIVNPAGFEQFFAVVLAVGGPMAFDRVLKMVAAWTNGNPGDR